MASTYSTDLRLELIGSGEQSGIWGSTTNLNLGSLVEQAIAGVEAIVIPSSNYALETFYGAVDESRNAVLVLSSGAASNVYVPPTSKVYVVKNTGSFAITMYNSTVVGNTTAAGTGVAVAAGTAVLLFTDGANFSAGGLPTGASTGTGNVVFSASPTLTGVPLAPTANAGTNTTQIATTAFVNSTVTSLSLGTMSTQNAANVAITGGTINGVAITNITDLAVADGGTGASTFTTNSVVLGNGTSSLAGNMVAPGTSGNALVSNGTTWVSGSPSIRGLGFGGETWRDVSGTYSVNTTYTNSFGYPIMLSASWSNGGGQFIVNGVGTALSTGANGNTENGLSIIVPTGATWQLFRNGSGMNYFTALY